MTDGTPINTSEYGMMHWGDGTIRQGHYLTLLATEFRLLKNSGQHEKAQVTLNELYYALNAYFRLDQFAEKNQDEIHGTNIDEMLSNPHNGFYNREDVGEDFATLHWSTDRMAMRCTNSAFYENNNSAEINNPSVGYIVKPNSYQNVPSMDQMTSMLVGLAMIIKFVDPVTVQPTPQDIPRNLVQQAREEIYFMITYAAENNWFLIDVHGWPVNNGGADLLFSGAALNRIYERFWNTGQLNTTAHRRLKGYKNVQAVEVGYDLNGPSDDTYDSLNWVNQIIYGEIFLENNYCPPLPNAPFTNSPFLNWQNCGAEFDVNSTMWRTFWTTFMPNRLGELYDDWLDDHKFGGVFGQNGSFYDMTLGAIEFDDLPLKSNNATIIYNLGVLTGWWDEQANLEWADATNNRELDLINALLNDQEPSHQVGFYKNQLDSLTLTGPYHLLAGTGGGQNIKSKYHENGWAAEYRWTNPVQAYGEGGERGVYSALDYMVLYNLFHLKYANQLPAYEESWTCNCASEVTATPQPGETSPADTEAYFNLNKKIGYLDECQEHIFYAVNDMVSGVFDIEPKFSEYPSLGIYTTKYQTRDAAVLPGGDINVKTRFVVCNGTLNIQTQGRIDVEQKEMILNANAVVNNRGEILVRTGTRLLLKNGSKLILRNGSKLRIEEGARIVVEEGATIEYYNGAQIEFIGTESEFVLGGTIRVMDAASFAIASPNLSVNKGKFIINSYYAAFLAMEPSYFTLEGNGIYDPFITIEPNCRLLIQDPDIVTFRIADCSVQLKENASFRAEESVYASNVHFKSTVNNLGLTVTDANNFINCFFTHVPVKAPLYLENTSQFHATGCTFTASDNTLNPSDVALVDIIGMGFQVSGCTFTANRSFGLHSEALVYPSQVTNTTFSQYGAAGTTVTGMHDASNVEIRSNGCTYTKCLTGIVKSSGKLSLKCNTFLNNMVNNVAVHNGCALNMSTNDLAGYNVVSKSAQDRSIAVSGATINLRNGYNFIEACANTVTGTLSTTCSGPDCTANFANNQWNTGNTVPGTGLFQLASTNGFDVTPLVEVVTVKPACGYYDGPVVIDPPRNRSAFASDGMPIIWSAHFNDSVRLDALIVSAMEQMTSYDSLGNDLAAVERFSEIFVSDVDPLDSLTGNYLWFAFDHMKSSLERAVAIGQIVAEQDQSSFEEHVAMYAAALRKMTAATIDELNYRGQFYHEIDKAHLFRVIGQPQIGLNILTELEACGVDSAAQAQLNYWKSVFQADVLIETLGTQALDTVISVDTTGYILPELAVNAFSFGAVINDLADIVYPNCGFFDHRSGTAQPAERLILFPNPATKEVTVRLQDPIAGIDELTVFLTDGRIVFSKAIAPGLTSISLAIGEWHPGIYQVRCHQPNGQWLNACLIVQ